MWDDAGTVEQLLECSIGSITLIKEGSDRRSEDESALSRSSEHTKPFGIGDGFQQSLPQLLHVVVLRKQQHIKASVRCR